MNWIDVMLVITSVNNLKVIYYSFWLCFKFSYISCMCSFPLDGDTSLLFLYHPHLSIYLCKAVTRARLDSPLEVWWLGYSIVCRSILVFESVTTFMLPWCNVTLEGQELLPLLYQLQVLPEKGGTVWYFLILSVSWSCACVSDSSTWCADSRGPTNGAWQKGLWRKQATSHPCNDNTSPPVSHKLWDPVLSSICFSIVLLL